MEITKSFYDFCIPFTNDIKKMKKVIEESINLGYRTIAIEQKFDHTKRKKSNDIFPVPVDLKLFSEFSDKIKILQRLTILFSDVGVSHQMNNSGNLKKYHLIAGLPETDAALNHCCTQFNGDIISFSEDDKFLVNRKSYQIAVKRGMFFEIQYSPIIKNTNSRKNIIKISHNYHSKGKSKNVIITSGATDPFDLRAPYDISNLALILGLSEEQGKSSISTNCRKLYIKAESRRFGKAVMILKNGPIVLSSLDSESDSEESNATKSSIESSENDDDSNNEKSKIQEIEDSTEDEQPKKKTKLN